MSEELLFGKVAEPDKTAVKFNKYFPDRMGEVDKRTLEVLPKLWSL